MDTRIAGLVTHTDELLGIPATGKEVQQTTGVAINRIPNGKLAEHWALIGAVGLLL